MMKIELILSIAGFFLAISGFNIANAINSFIKNRIDLVKELNAIRDESKNDNQKLENLARTKINKIVGAIKSLSAHQQEIIEKHNEFAENLFQIQGFLQRHHQFQIKKKSPDTIGNVNPFDSLELDFSVTEQEDLTK